MFSANSSQVSDATPYVEDVFSTWLYTGTSTTDNKITNGIDLAGKGGMVWLKSRTGAFSNYLTTNSTTTSSGGGTTWLYSDTTDALLGAVGNGLCNFFSDGFDINPTGSGVNATGSNYASWTFREAPKFFDVVTYTGNGANRTIAHNLGVAPGCIIVKRTDAAANWQVYHRSLGATLYMSLNTTDGSITSSTRWNDTTPTATTFTVGTDTTVNANGGTYVAYLFAHDATSEGVIQCGSYTGTGNASTAPLVSLGWEPQWILIKQGDGPGNWNIFDNMRGMPVGSADAILQANLTNAETSVDYISPTATGFQAVSANSAVNGNGSPYIYIAIRRGPMRTPTSGTSVFAPLAVNNASGTINTIGFPYDLQISQIRIGDPAYFVDRLRGVNSTTSTLVTSPYLQSQTTNAEASLADFTRGVSNTGFTTSSQLANTNNTYWSFRRAPSFFDEVCYTGTGVARTVNHNLGVAPELIIVKSRSAASTFWYVFASSLGADRALLLNTDGIGASSASYWNSTMPTSTVFSVKDVGGINGSGASLVAYLFASCPGVSKVGSYTGNGSSQTINCGFAAGARFVLIKRTDSTGDWYVWDTARGIVAGNDPHLSLNTTAAEVTTDDSIDTDSSGFVVNQVAATNINVSSATYIYLAVA